MTISFFSLTFAVFVALFAINTASSHKVIDSNRKCSIKLEGIIYGPETCAKKYFDQISKQFRANSEILFTDTVQADAFLYNFASTYQVIVAIATPMGANTLYNPDGSQSEGFPNQYTNTAQAFLNFPGFIRQVSDFKFYYSFNAFSRNGQYYGVTLSMPLSRDPLYCWMRWFWSRNSLKSMTKPFTIFPRKLMKSLICRN